MQLLRQLLRQSTLLAFSKPACRLPALTTSQLRLSKALTPGESRTKQQWGGDSAQQEQALSKQGAGGTRGCSCKLACQVECCLAKR